MSASDPIDVAKTALVLIEYQNEFTTEGGKLNGAVKDCMEATKTLENSKKLLDAARSAGMTVIHVPISFTRVHAAWSVIIIQANNYCRSNHQ